jgi:GTP-binding protein EngB required for normal cell division
MGDANVLSDADSTNPSPDEGAPARLNEHQQRHLLVSCRHIDKLLAEIEDVLTASTSGSPFPRYRSGLLPVQKKVVEDYLQRIRARLVRVLASQDMHVEPPSIDSTFAIRTVLMFADNAIEELRPKYMRGYGAVPPAVVPEIEGLVDELRSVIQKLSEYLAQDPARDFSARLAQLERQGDEVETVRTLERIIRAHGLVEYRQALGVIVDRLANPALEIAIFGRVSSGKSSLLNHLVGAPLLPVGVTPITAVPTALLYGEQPGLSVSFADRPPFTGPIDDVAQYVSEDANPGNARHVTHVEVRWPSARLRSGVVFVDTPGLGSIATRGSEETLAYLPRCDVGIVLVDAASTLSPEDVATVGALRQAGIPASVLVSKADLVSAADLTRIVRHVSEQLERQLGRGVAVRPISSADGHAALVDAWFAEEIAPLYDRYHEAALASIRRKTGALKQSVRASLEAESRHAKTPVPPSQVVEAGRALQRAGGLFAETLRTADASAREIGGLTETVIGEATQRLVLLGGAVATESALAQGALRNALVAVLGPRVDGIRADLLSIAEPLAVALTQAASRLGRPEVVSADDLKADVRPLPPPPDGVGRLALRYTWLAPFSDLLFARSIRAQLHASVEQKIEASVQGYSALVVGWVRDAVASVQARFHERAEPLRAFIERVGASRGAGGEGTPDSKSEPDDRTLLDDVTALAGRTPADGEGTLT